MLQKMLSKLRVSRLQWHDLRNIKPVSRTFGFDRGTPIDRYYIENFLAANRHYIKGTVLEIAENYYSKKFGQEVASYEVLHVKPSERATIVGDLTKPETLPQSQVDCFICTQVLNFIYDFHKAIQSSYKMLRPGGVILATVGGISPISRYDADRWGHFWSFYPQGIEKAFKEVFGEGNVLMGSHGNSLAAISFIKGIAVEELTKEELDFNDFDYPVSITIIAQKPVLFTHD